MSFPHRDLHGPGQSRAIFELIQSIFVSELLNPSEVLWLHFAWISDIEILDNSSRKFYGINPSWPPTKIRLTKILEVLLSKGAKIRLTMREDESNEYILHRLEKLKARYAKQIEWRILKNFHDKGMVGDSYFLSGSMNLTKYGITVNKEHVYLRTDPKQIAEEKIYLQSEWDSYPT